MPAKPTTKYNSIESWARALGSKAKTHGGQRRFILKQFKPQRYPVRPTRPSYHVPVWRTPYQENIFRLARFANAIDLAKPLPKMSPAARELVDLRLYNELTLGTHAIAVQDAVNEPQRLFRQHMTLNGWTILAVELAEYDYSGRLAQKHVIDRIVRIRKVEYDGTIADRDQHVDGWDGDWLLDALVESEIITGERKRMNVRLHEAYSLVDETVRWGFELAGRPYSIYRRRIGDAHIDYCATTGNTTYHAPTPQRAILGLELKLKAKHDMISEVISWDLGIRLGFCAAGMLDFARTFGLNLEGQYTPMEIDQRIKNNPPAARMFESELRKLGRAVNYNFV